MTATDPDRPDRLPASELLGPLPDPSMRQVRAIAISTLTGSAAMDGNTQAMGNATDSELFQSARRWSDVVVVGAGTVRDENYGGVLVSADQQAERTARGQSPIPRIAVLSRTFALNPAMRFFTEATAPPLILAPHSAIEDPSLAPLRESLEQAGAEILDCADGSAAAIVETLHRNGFNRIDCEGGPLIFGEMFAADLIDVLHLTIEPLLTSHLERPLLDLPEDAGHFTRRLELSHVAATADGTVFLRYQRRSQPADPEC